MSASRLTFSDGFVWFDGKPYRGITKVLGAVGVSPKVVDWKIQQAIRMAQQVSDLRTSGKIDSREYERQMSTRSLNEAHEKPRAIARGKGVAAHSLLESIASGDSDAMAHWREKEPIKFRAIEGCLLARDLTLVDAERYVFMEEHGVCAKFDAVAERKGSRVLISFKRTRDVYPEHHLQLACEFHADFLGTDSAKEEWACDEAWIMILRGDTCELIQSQPRENLSALLHYIGIWKWMRERQWAA